MKNQAPRLGRPIFIPDLAAAAAGIATVVIVVVATAVVAAAAIAEDQQQNDDPPPVVTAEAATDTVIVAHKNTSKNFVELCCPHSMLFRKLKKVQRLESAAARIFITFSAPPPVRSCRRSFHLSS